jgi:hypothetical protein
MKKKNWKKKDSSAFGLQIALCSPKPSQPVKPGIRVMEVEVK